MWHLAKNELLRFRGLAIAAAIVHLAILGAQAALGSLFVPVSVRLDTGLLRYGLPIYVGIGLTFALAQWRTYKQPALWMHLLHRPLPPQRIFFALAGAASLLLLIVIALPLFGVTFVLDHLSTRWIDLRQYGMTPFVFGTTLSGYLAGCTIVLHPSRIAIATLLLPLLFLSRDGSGWWSVLIMVVVLAWLALLTRAFVVPDRSRPSHQPFVVILGTLPLQYVLFGCLLFVGLLAYSTSVVTAEYGWGLRGFALHSWDGYFDKGTYARASYLYDGEALVHGLDLAPTERSRRLRGHIDLDGVHELAPRWWKAPVRHQPMYMDRQQTLDDTEHDRRFVFSHDQMRFQGWRVRSLSTAGWLGLSGAVADALPADDNPSRFPEVPRVVDNQQVIVGSRIYMFDPQRLRFDLRFEGASDERLTTPLIDHGAFVSALSDRRLYLFRTPDTDLGRVLQPGPGRLSPSATVALPGVSRNLLKVLVGPLDRGFAVSFIFGTLSERDLLAARQVVLEALPNGETEVVADQTLEQGPPAWSRHWGFIMSPLLQTLHDLVWNAIDPRHHREMSLDEATLHRRPQRVVVLALLVALIAAGLAAMLARRRLGPRQSPWPWIVATALGGAPGILGFLIAGPKQELPIRVDGDRGG